VAVPVHPVAKPDRLLGLHAGKLVHPLLAELHKLVDAGEAVAGHEVLDVAFRAQAQLLFDFDFDPKPLAIETILIALFVAGHGKVSLVDILVSPAPSVVDAHRVVGRDRAVEKRPLRLAAILLAELLERANALPELQNGPLLSREIDLR